MVVIRSMGVLGILDKYLTEISEEHWENLLLLPRTDKENFSDISELFRNKKSKI